MGNGTIPSTGRMSGDGGGVYAFLTYMFVHAVNFSTFVFITVWHVIRLFNFRERGR